MLNESALEERLLALEQIVSDLQRQLGKSTPKTWLDDFIGSVSDEASFLEALEYGRSFRESDQPLAVVQRGPLVVGMPVGEDMPQDVSSDEVSVGKKL